MRIAVADKKALELCHLRITGVSREHNPASCLAEYANTAPDGRLRNEVCDIAFCAHEPLQLVARYPKNAALGDRQCFNKRSLRVQKIQLAGEFKSTMMSDDLRFAIRNGQEKC